MGSMNDDCQVQERLLSALVLSVSIKNINHNIFTKFTCIRNCRYKMIIKITHPFELDVLFNRTRSQNGFYLIDPICLLKPYCLIPRGIYNTLTILQ